MGATSDHGVVENSISHAQRSPTKYLSRHLQIPGRRVGGNHRRSRDNVWFRNFVEQLAAISQIRTFAVYIDQTVENVATWTKPRSYHVGMDVLSERMGNGAPGAAKL
ncbi:hypothetical protein TorRG33x02_334600 [Trema orientale]|uniref:Uncharacterized protein n=1 Tax=Trema orientale TaxID=63057 RepID=A0A2P5B2F4_TREOI|nr:hypothetical protein TorRG33x02_334600 [Trema orientale]